MKKKTKSILAIVLAVILLIVVAVTLVINVLFSHSDTPKVFGYYIYMMEYDTMEVPVATDVTTLSETDDSAAGAVEETSDGDSGESVSADSENDAASSIHQYTAVIAKEYSKTDPVAKNNAVLCVLADDDTSTDVDSERIAVRRIYDIEQDSTGMLLYYPTTMRSEMVGTEPAITVDSILGKCTYESGELYSFVKFATGASGILLMLVLPCVILVIMLIVAIVRVNSRHDEEYAFEENYDEMFSEDSYDDAGDYDEELGRSPLYRPNGGGGNQSFAQRYSSIAENFERKAVNPNSPYQKARTMQFKAQRDVPIYTDQEDQIPLGGTTGRNAADDRMPLDLGYEDAHSGSVSNTGSFGRYADDTVISHAVSETPTATSSQDLSAYRGSHEAGSPEEACNLGSSRFSSGTSASSTRQPTSYASTSSRSSRNKYENASVDELLAMIEDEKKKLDQ